MDLTEAFTADRAPVDLMQIAFEELAAAARRDTFRIPRERSPARRVWADENRLRTFGRSRFDGDQAIGPIAKVYDFRLDQQTATYADIATAMTSAWTTLSNLAKLS